MECEQCNKKLFKIDLISCGGCEYNGAMTEHDGYIFDSDTIEKNDGLYRNMVADEGECKMGSSSGGGCYLIECNECGNKTNIALMWD